MVFVRCDRCGAIVNKRTIIFNQTDSETQEEVSQVIGVPIRHWDLCDECWKSYCEWLLNNDKSKEEVSIDEELSSNSEIEVISVNEPISTEITNENNSKKKSKKK